VQTQPKIRAYDEQAPAGFSIYDLTHALHYLLKMLGNMQQLDGKTSIDNF
jgi:hypothetical protein